MADRVENIVVLGATSAIAMASARLLASSKRSFFLVARDPEKLLSFAADLEIRSQAHVSTFVCDLADVSKHEEVRKRSAEALGRIDLVLIAYGILGDQKKAEADFSVAAQVLHTNFISAASLLTVYANWMEKQESGTLAVISSVAGDRGRQSNYAYGASKAGLDVFLEGLRNRMYAHNVDVLTVKPGFVETPMTNSLPKNKLFASPETVARVIVAGVYGRKNIVYAPWYWRFIMCGIRSIPETLFKRLRL